jgi:uncharacterized DUF497 family protein
MRFTWDPGKAKRNEKAHGISFETAQEAFEDPNQVVSENYFFDDQGEQRHQVIGMVIFVDRSDPSAEVIHIISARKAVDYKANIYKDQFR